MDEKSANIDLVFRNGLKEYEVLPPREVWGQIRPVIRKKQQPLIILRAAAVAAVLVSLSFLAYRLSVQVSTGPDNYIVTQDLESEVPSSISPQDEFTPSATVETSNKPVIAKADLHVIRQDYISALPGEFSNRVQDVAYQTESAGISVNNQNAGKPDLLILYKPVEPSMDFISTETLYSPEIPVKDASDKWTIAALVSPTYYTNFFSGKDELASALASEEQPLFSYSGGVAFSYKINKRLSVQSGVYYSSFGQELSGITSFGGFQQYDYTKGDRNFEVLTANGVVYTNNADVFLLDNRMDDRISTRYTDDVFDPAKANLTYIDNSLRQNFSYLELPLIMRYKLIDKTIDFNILGGLSSNLLINNAVYAALEGSKYQVGKTEGLNLITFSSSLGMGMEYNFSGNLSLNLEPTFRYYLNHYNQISGIRVHPYSFGIFSGISYKF